MKPLQQLDRDLRRARLLAARGYQPKSIPRVGITSGHWDNGQIVFAFRNGKGQFRDRATYARALPLLECLDA